MIKKTRGNILESFVKSKNFINNVYNNSKKNKIK